MRRNEREIKALKEIEQIIARCQVCRIALCDKDMPYIVPMNFGYKNKCLYLHTANDGKKMDIIKQNPKICFEMDIDNILKPGQIACKWTMDYKSVIGSGVAEVITDDTKKREGLQIIMQQYAGNQTFDFIPKVMDMMSIIKVPIDEMTGKKSGQ